MNSIMDSIKTEAENSFSDIPYPPIGLDIKTEDVPIDFEWRDEDKPAVNLNNKLNMDPIDKEIHLTQMDDKETNKCHQCGYIPGKHNMITRSQKIHEQCIKFGVRCKHYGLWEAYMLTRHQEMKI